MRKKGEIQKDGAKVEYLLLEVLLDVRELLLKATKKSKKTNKGGV